MLKQDDFGNIGLLESHAVFKFDLEAFTKFFELDFHACPP